MYIYKIKDMQTLTCKHCNEIFELTRKDKVYCSRSCKQNSSAIRTGRRKRKRCGPDYIQIKKENCVICNFIPIHTCQLDIDHIDGNPKNNSVENLQTLCANCHRLKTYQNQDWLSIT